MGKNSLSGKSEEGLVKKLAKPFIAGMASAIMLVPSLSLAGGAMTCYYPKTCKEIVSSEYSTGGGDSVIQYIELDCRTKEGEYVKYIDRMGSVGGFFGVGRFTQPDKIYFRKGNEDELQCK